MGCFIPSGPHEITAEWLTAALRAWGNLDQAAVQSVDISALTADHGMTGNLVRLTLSYDQDEDSVPRSMIAKFATTNPIDQQVLFTITFHYEREHRFYEKIANRVQLKTPRCYYSDINIEDRRYILLLEDMAPAKSGNMALGCTIEQAKLAIAEIAGFHATWWDGSELEKMTWMPEFGKTQIAQMSDMYLAAWEPFCQRIGHRLPQEFKDIGFRLTKHFKQVWSQIVEPPLTLVHADYHIENLFFIPSESGDRLVVADWQMMMFGRGTLDVGFLLGGNLDPQERFVKEMDLLGLYHTILQENGVNDYSFEQCFHDYRISMLFSLSRWIIVMGIVLSEEQAISAWEGQASRYVAAVLDLDIGSLIPA